MNNDGSSSRAMDEEYTIEMLEVMSKEQLLTVSWH